MFVKTIATLLLLGFFYVQLGSSLECYSCNNPTGCNAPTKITCDTNNANETTAHLHYYCNTNLTNLASTNFDCFFHNLTEVSNNVTFKGCIYRAIEPCSLPFKTEFAQLKREDCLKCSGNLCNTNPAGTFSSSIMTMFASVAVVAIFKVLKM